MEKLAKNNAAFVLDVLSGRLVFERTGVKLYDSAIEKIERRSEPRYHALLGQLHQIRNEEAEHAAWLEAQIRALGGNPDEKTDLAALEAEEATGIKSVIVDGHDKVIHVLHALLAAELADNAGWDLLVKLADDTGDRPAKLAFAKRLAEEAKHLLFIREAVVRAAEVEILGRDVAMPRGMRSVLAGSLRKPLAMGGASSPCCSGSARWRPRRCSWRGRAWRCARAAPWRTRSDAPARRPWLEDLPISQGDQEIRRSEDAGRRNFSGKMPPKKLRRHSSREGRIGLSPPEARRRNFRAAKIATSLRLRPAS